MQTATTHKIWLRGYFLGLYLLLLLIWLVGLLIQPMLYLLRGRKVSTAFPLGRRWWGALIEAAIFFLLLLVLSFLYYKDRKGIAWNDTNTYEGMYTAWEIGHTDCPTSVDELVKAVGKKGQSTKDPWGSDYVVSCPSQHDLDIDVCSNGPDKQQGTDDDVCNWKPHCEVCAYEMRDDQ